MPINDNDISVTKEILYIREMDSIFEGRLKYELEQYVEVSVYYEFFNSGPEKEILVGFEAESPFGDVDGRPFNGEHPFMKDFTVNLNGDSLPFSISYLSWKDSLQHSGLNKAINDIETLELKYQNPNAIDFYYVYHFKARFKKGKNIVKHTYRMALSSGVDLAMSFDYKLTTANRWANRQIDDFTLIIDLDMYDTFTVEGSFFSGTEDWTCAQGKMEWIRAIYPYLDSCLQISSIKESLVFHKTNFAPEGELYVFTPYFAGIRGPS